MALRPPSRHAVADRSEAGSAPRTVEDLIRRAQEMGASDVHLQMRGHASEIAFRLDGCLTPATDVLDEPLAGCVFGRIKFLARLRSYEDALPQDGRIAHEDVGSLHDIRVSTYPTVTGEKIVLRLFERPRVCSLDELGFPATARAALEHFLRQHTGLMLLTGPVGSGKTTTIHACLAELTRTGGRHIVTIEDPVEQIIPGIMQTEIHEAAGLTFARAAKHLLRQDPEVMVIGEIRDEETASLAVRAALTGHLVISTLHAGSCGGVMERLFTLCPDRAAASAAVSMIVNQRLVRQWCAACQGSGCDPCRGTGFRGRIPAVEFVHIDDAIRWRMRPEHDGANAVRADPGLATSLRALADDGRTSPSEIERLMPYELG